MHVAGVEVTVGREEVTSITAAVEEIQPTPSITMSSTDIMEFGENESLIKLLFIIIIINFIFERDHITFQLLLVTSNHKH